MDISNHRTDVTSRVGLTIDARLEDLDGILDGLVPVDGVTLIAGVDPLAPVSGEFHIDPSVHKLTIILGLHLHQSSLTRTNSYIYPLIITI